MSFIPESLTLCVSVPWGRYQVWDFINFFCSEYQWKVSEAAPVTERTYGGAIHIVVCLLRRAHNLDQRSDPVSHLDRIAPEVLLFCEVSGLDVCNTRLWSSLWSNWVRKKGSHISYARYVSMRRQGMRPMPVRQNSPANGGVRLDLMGVVGTDPPFSICSQTSTQKSWVVVLPTLIHLAKKNTRAVPQNTEDFTWINQQRRRQRVRTNEEPIETEKNLWYKHTRWVSSVGKQHNGDY